MEKFNILNFKKTKLSEGYLVFYLRKLPSIKEYAFRNLITKNNNKAVWNKIESHFKHDNVVEIG